MNANSNPRDSIFFDLDLDNISNYNLKKSFSIDDNDYLKIEELNYDNKIFEIEEKFDKLRQRSKL